MTRGARVSTLGEILVEYQQFALGASDDEIQRLLVIALPDKDGVCASLNSGCMASIFREQAIARQIPLVQQRHQRVVRKLPPRQSACIGKLA